MEIGGVIAALSLVRYGRPSCTRRLSATTAALSSARSAVPLRAYAVCRQRTAILDRRCGLRLVHLDAGRGHARRQLPRSRSRSRLAARAEEHERTSRRKSVRLVREADLNNAYAASQEEP